MAYIKTLSTYLVFVYVVGVHCVVKLESKLGTLHGSRRKINTTHLTDTVSDEVDIYIGLPYAEPPIGKNRFRETVPVKRWTGIRNGTLRVERVRCLALHSFLPSSKISEDCLYLDIYTPNEVTNPARKFPVMVYIHGGSYEAGSANDYDGTILASKGVVVVIINYRLNVFGLFTSGDHRLPGNYAFYDQIESLKWVQNYIEDFRGDPDKVTIFGNSAGGGSVGILLLTPLAKGLFHHAIVQSGPVTAFWAIHLPTDCDLQEKFEKNMKSLGCPTSDTEKILECLQDYKPADMESAFAMQDFCGALLKEKPWVDGKLIPLPASVALKTGRYNRVPTIIGTVSHEWAHNMGWTKPKDIQMTNIDLGVDREAYSLWLDSLVHRFPHFKGAMEFIKFEYTNWTDPDSPQNNRDQFIQLFSDLTMVAPSTEMADMMVHHTPTWFYIFSHTHKLNTSLFGQARLHDKAYHQIELNYLFGGPSGYQVFADVVYGKEIETERNREVEDRMTNMWRNFATNGNPNKRNKTWTQYTSATRDYLNIGTMKSEMKLNYERHRMHFWNNVIEPRRQKLLNKAAGMSMEKAAMWTLFSFCVFLVLIVVILVCFLRRLREINQHSAAQRYSTNSRKQLTLPT